MLSHPPNIFVAARWENWTRCSTPSHIFLTLSNCRGVSLTHLYLVLEMARPNIPLS